MAHRDRLQSGRLPSQCLHLCLLTIIVVVIIAGGCRRCPQIEREAADTVRQIQTVYVSASLTDSLRERFVVRDSVAPRLDSAGNVTGMDSWHWRDRIVYRRGTERSGVAVTDTIWRTRTETLTETVEVERKKTLIEKAVNAVGWTALLLAVLGLTARLIYNKVSKRG